MIIEPGHDESKEVDLAVRTPMPDIALHDQDEETPASEESVELARNTTCDDRVLSTFNICYPKGIRHLWSLGAYMVVVEVLILD